MIDIVICSNNLQQTEDLRHNIERTCGADFRLQIVDNTCNKHDIFTAYDSAIKICSGQIVVCCHQDIVFHTVGWGKILEHYFAENSNLGAVGVAGGSAHSKVPGSWMTAPPHCKRLINILQHRKDNTIYHDCTIDKQTVLYPAAVIDGVFMAFRRSVFEKVSFASSGLEGFHGYDIDISLQLQKHNWEVMVCSEILIEHFSMGNYSTAYIENIINIHKRFASLLPVLLDTDSKHNRKYETKSLLFFAYTMLEANVPAKLFIRTVFSNLKHCTPFCKSAVLLALTFFSLLKKH